MDKSIKKAMRKCKNCEYYDKEKKDCLVKEIKDCSEKDIRECEYFLVKEKLVMF